jgi:hypothetical protein
MAERDPRIEPEDPMQEGSASTVDDWFGQEAAEDAELAERLAAEGGEEQAERAFDEQSHHAEAASGAKEGRSAD